MKKALLSIVVILVLIQFTSPVQTNPKEDDLVRINAPKEVLNILKKSCYDCHSNETKWTWYSSIAPFSWVIVGHVDDGRKALNFSQYKNIDKDIKEKRLKRIIQTTNNGMMPLSSYTSFHEGTELNTQEKQLLRDWANTQLKILN